MGRMSGQLLDRRVLLRAILSVPWVAAVVPAMAASVRTPSATEGPFYPTGSMRFANSDNDLTMVSGAAGVAEGEIIDLSGRVLDRTGKAMPGVRVEIWQCDANGRYLHTGDDQKVARDGAFQGFGVTTTAASGTYQFRTIKPVAYPGRTPHIHVKVFHGDRVLTTQFYMAGHRQNNRDGIYRRLNRQQRKSVEMTFRRSGNWPVTNVDIVI